MAQIWLIPVDGSPSALKAIAWVIAHAGDLREMPALHLLNVQPSLPADIGRFINAEQLRDFHREEGMKALAEAERQLADADLAAHGHVSVGDCAETIVEFVAKLGCGQIIVGTRGHTGLGGTLLGSVAAKIVHLSPVPVLLVR